MANCKGCTERHIGCHSDCHDYMAYRAEIAKIAEGKRQYTEDGAYFLSKYARRKNQFIKDDMRRERRR